MLMTISTTYQPATDLGFLLHKNPNKLHEFTLSFGKAYVFYKDIQENLCTACLLLEINSIDLVRGQKTYAYEYISDRAYAASSFLSVAISNVFGSGLNGACRDKPELAETTMPLTVALKALPARGGKALLERLFLPLGYEMEIEEFYLNDNFPQWGMSPYVNLTLTKQATVASLLNHLYVLIPVLDDDKHYWVGEDEVAKLLDKGDIWLKEHPEKEVIAYRYLKHRKRLTREALAQLTENDTDAQSIEYTKQEEALEKPLSLNSQRLNKVLTVLKQHNVKKVMDLGCGEGKFIKALMDEKTIEDILGMDVSLHALQVAEDKLKLEKYGIKGADKVKLIQGSLIYKDKRLQAYPAATLIEVIEHMDENRLSAFEKVLFGFTQPKLVIITTPNFEYNVKFAQLNDKSFRHKDHRFEWTRAQFQTWAKQIAQTYHYQVSFDNIGEIDENLGSATQMGVFIREG